MSRELLQRSLDALEAEGHPGKELLAALRAALAAPEAEPVAWRRHNRSIGWQYEDGATSFAADPSAEPLYATPQARPAQEPVAYAQNPKDDFWCWCNSDEPGAIALYATPPAQPAIDGFGGNLDSAFDAAPAVPDGLRDAVNTLLHQIDIGDFVDSNGHSAKMLKPVHDLMRLMSESAAPVVWQPLPDHQIVTMYDECPRCDADMIEFAREVERAHGITGDSNG